MASRRVIKAVLGNFLGTYISRYSDFDGYWLFGFLVESPDDIRVDVLQENHVTCSGSPSDLATTLAVAKFDDQRPKAGLAPSQVRSAWLTIRRMPGTGSVLG